jgi:hypothetical protein
MTKEGKQDNLLVCLICFCFGKLGGAGGDLAESGVVAAAPAAGSSWWSSSSSSSTFFFGHFFSILSLLFFPYPLLPSSPLLLLRQRAFVCFWFCEGLFPSWMHVEMT